MRGHGNGWSRCSPPCDNRGSMCSVCSSTWPDNPAPGWPRVGLPHILKTRPTPPPDTRQRPHQPGAIQVPSPSGGGKLGHLRPQWFAYQTPSQAAVIAGSLIQFASAGEVGEREAPACSQTDLNETRHLRHKPPIEHRRPGERAISGYWNRVVACSVFRSGHSGRARNIVAKRSSSPGMSGPAG